MKEMVDQVDNLKKKKKKKKNKQKEDGEKVKRVTGTFLSLSNLAEASSHLSCLLFCLTFENSNQIKLLQIASD